MGHTALKGMNGVATVKLAFGKKLGWFYREQAEADYGVDGIVEMADNEVPNGRLFAVQVKSGKSFFKKKGNGYVFRGEQKHLDYWTHHSLPVFIILHNPETDLILWQKIERDQVEVGQSGYWSIFVPSNQILDKECKPYLQHLVPRDIYALRKLRLALDIGLLQRIAEQETYLEVEEWVNKGLGVRNPKLWFGPPPHAQPANWEETNWASGHDVIEFIERRFPYLDVEYIEEPDGNADEMCQHTFFVTLNDVGKSALVLEDYYQNGHQMAEEPVPPESEVDDDFDYDAAHETWGEGD